MNLDGKLKDLMDKMPFVPFVTQGEKEPHLIVLGKGFVIDDVTVAFFGWRQGETSRNILNNRHAQFVLVSEEKNAGYRVSGTASIEKEGEIYESLKAKFPRHLGDLGFATVIKVDQIDPLL